MSYSNILSLIDSEIELLTSVRNLLSEAASPAQPMKKQRPTRRAKAEPASSAEPLPVAQERPRTEAAEVAPVTHKVHSVRARSTGRRRRVPPVLAGALAASIPAGPVAVSAAVVAERRDAQSREAANARAEQQEAVLTEGTLDALLRELKVRETAA